MSRLAIVLILTLIISSCNFDRKQQARIDAIEDEYGVNSYPAGLAYMTYLMKWAFDLDYSIDLVNKLIKSQNFTEARYALENLEDKYLDFRIYYLKSVCFRNQLQFDSAEVNIRRAMTMSQAPVLQEEMEYIQNDRAAWNEVLFINQKIRKEGLTPDLRFQRAEKLVLSGHFEAAGLDIDSLLEKNLLVDESYDLAVRMNLFQNQYQAVEALLREWEGRTNDIWRERIAILSKSIQEIIRLKSKISAGEFNPPDIVNLSRNLVQAGNYKEAESILSQAIIRFPDNINLKYALLLTYIQSGQAEKARDFAGEMRREGIELPGEIKGYVED
jgi:uncharacterized protein HemY